MRLTLQNTYLLDEDSVEVVAAAELLDEDEAAAEEVEAATLEDDEVVPQKYISSLFPAPQNSPGYPGQGKLHSESSI